MVRQRKTTKAKEKDVRMSAESIEDTSFKCTSLLKFCMLFMVMLYLIIPTILVVIPQVIEQVVFMNLYLGSREQEMLKTPTASWNLQGVANFRITSNDVELGMWHVLPKGRISHYNGDNVVTMEEIESELGEAESLIIYHHGNGMTRASGDHNQRNKLYHLLQEEGYHVIAFEYRGFGDSTGWPSEVGLVNDSIATFKWVKERTSSRAKISFWGHSLGSSIASLSASRINRECLVEQDITSQIYCPGPDALILEGPFTNVKKGAEDSIVAHLFMAIYPRIIFDYILETSLSAVHVELATDRHISDVRCPIMLLHADDDDIISSTHSDELYGICEKNMKHEKRRVKLIKFDKSHGYNHMDIYKAPQLTQLLKEFLEEKNDEPSFQAMTL